MCKLGTLRDNEYIKAVHEKITKKKREILFPRGLNSLLNSVKNLKSEAES